MSKSVKWDISVKDPEIKRLCECNGCDFCNKNNTVETNSIDPKCNIWSSININKKWICEECIKKNLIYSL